MAVRMWMGNVDGRQSIHKIVQNTGPTEFEEKDSEIGARDCKGGGGQNVHAPTTCARKFSSQPPRHASAHLHPKVYPGALGLCIRVGEVATPVGIRTNTPPRTPDDPRKYERMGASPISRTYTSEPAPLSNSTARAYPGKTSAHEKGDRRRTVRGDCARTGTRASPSLRVRGYVRGPA